MFELILTIQFILFFLLFSLLIIFWKSKKIQKWSVKNRSKIELFYIIVSIFTVISVFVGLWQLSSQQEQFYLEQEHLKTKELENQKSLLYALKDEIDIDIFISEDILNSSDKLLETQELPINRFSTFVIKEVINQGDIGGIEFKTDLRKLYTLTENSNRMLDQVSLFIPATEQQFKIFLKLRKERVNLLIEYNKEIKPLLYDLKFQVDSLIQTL